LVAGAVMHSGLRESGSQPVLLLEGHECKKCYGPGLLSPVRAPPEFATDNSF